MEIVLIKSTDIVALVMPVTLGKTVPQVSFMFLVCLFKLDNQKYLFKHKRILTCNLCLWNFYRSNQQRGMYV